MTEQLRWALGMIALLAAGAACSGEDPPAATGAPMGAAPDTTRSASWAANTPPTIESVRLSPSAPRPGARITANVTASDSDGDAVELSYRWRVAGNKAGANGSTLHLEGAPKGSLIEVIVIARDDTGESEPARATARIGNQPPRVHQVVLEPLGDVTTANQVSASPRGSDPDGDELSYEFTWRVNGETQFESGPVLSNESFSRGDSIELIVVASDGHAQSERLESAPITVANAVPRITSSPGSFGEDGVFRYQLLAEDADGDRLFRYRLESGPADMKVDPVTGLLTWEPVGDQTGMHPVQVVVDDRHGGEASQRFTVSVSYEEVAASGEVAPPAAPAN